MRAARVLPVLFLLCISFHTNCGYLLGVVEGVVSYALENIADEIFENLPESNNLEKRFSDINHKLQIIETKILHDAQSNMETINQLVIGIERSTLETRFNELSQLIRQVAAQEITMKNYIAHEDHLNAVTFLRFAKWTTAPDTSAMQSMLDQIHFLITRSAHSIISSQGSIVSHLASLMKDHPEYVCSVQRSAKQVLYLLYATVQITEIKGYLMMQYSWIYRGRVEGVGEFTIESKLMEQRFRQRQNQTFSVFRDVMSTADDAVYRCDPKEHLEGQTYLRITRLAEGIIQKRDLFDGVCEDGNHCQGVVDDCERLRGQWNPIRVCISGHPDRRYDNVRADDVFYGQVCRGREERMYWNNLCDGSFFLSRVTYHFCTCFGNYHGAKSNRKFSLRESRATVDENKVITGVRFRKLDRVIHLQIQEGFLGPYGAINSSEVYWKPMPRLRMDNETLTAGIDYHTLTMKDRAIDLNGAKGARESVVTGVRFIVRGGHLKLQVHTTNFNWQTGKLNLGSGSWISQNETIALERIKLENPGVPTKMAGLSVMNSREDQFIEFSSSGRLADAGQTTIPYLDAQDVITKPPMPLSGVSLYFKASQGSGGFIAPRIHTYDVFVHQTN